MRIRFGSYRLDDQRFILERDGERVSIRPKVFDLLAYLVRDRERVVPREELVEALWGGNVIGMGSLSGLVNELRKLLGEEGRGPSSIRTVHARGYQFVARIEASEDEETHRRDFDVPADIPDRQTPYPPPEVLPPSIARALWLHLREDAGRIVKTAQWLEQLHAVEVRPVAKRLEWKPASAEAVQPLRVMRQVDASTARVKAVSRDDWGQGLHRGTVEDAAQWMREPAHGGDREESSEDAHEREEAEARGVEPRG